MEDQKKHILLNIAVFLLFLAYIALVIIRGHYFEKKPATPKLQSIETR